MCEISTSIIPLFQSFTAIAGVYQGRRASRCSALAPGYHISRLRRSVRLSYFAPSALSPAFIFRAFGAQFRLFVQSRTRRRVFGRVTTQYALYISVPKRFRGASVKSLGKYEVFSEWVEDIQNYNTEAVLRPHAKFTKFPIKSAP